MTPELTQTKRAPQPDDPRQRLLGLGFAVEMVDAIELRSAIWALASDFSNGQCEMTHSEVVSSDEKISQVVLCLKLFAHSYGEFSEFLSKQAAEKLPPTDNVSVAIGFNYDNPGLIEIKQGVVSYSLDKDILNIPDTTKLTYGQGESRRLIELLEDSIWKSIRE